MTLFIQLLAIIIIILLGVVILRLDPIKLDVKRIASAAMFVVIAVILSFFSLMIPLFGFSSLRIGLSQLALMIMGIVLGPSWAFVGGLVEDFLEILFVPSGFPFFGFTLNKVLVALIPALIFSAKNKLNPKHHTWIINALMILITVCSLGYIWTVQDTGATLVLNVWVRISASVACCICVGFMLFVTNYLTRKYKDEQQIYPIAKWALAVLLVEIIVQFLLTPVWLQAMYGIPWIMSISIRIFKACFMLQVNILLGYFILRSLKNVINKLNAS